MTLLEKQHHNGLFQFLACLSSMCSGPVRNKRRSGWSCVLTLDVLTVAVQPARTAKAKLSSVTAACLAHQDSHCALGCSEVSNADNCQVVTCSLSTPSPVWALCITEAFRMMKLLQEHMDAKIHLETVVIWGTVGCCVEVTHNAMFVND